MMMMMMLKCTEWTHMVWSEAMAQYCSCVPAPPPVPLPLPPPEVLPEPVPIMRR